MEGKVWHPFESLVPGSAHLVCFLVEKRKGFKLEFKQGVSSEMYFYIAHSSWDILL